MDEFVIVRFAEDGRTVMLDDRAGGLTNERMIVNTGTHLFSLGGRKDFVPAEKEVVVENTSENDPLIVRFRRAPGTARPAVA